MNNFMEKIFKHGMEKYAHVLAQREEILTAFIAKFGTEPEHIVQIERRNSDGTTTWSLEIDETLAQKYKKLLAFVKASQQHSCCLCIAENCISCNAKSILEEIGESTQ